MSYSKIGILSDTHDQIDNILIAIKYFNKICVDLVIHCGDWVSPFSLVHYLELNAPISGIFGNNDGDIFRHIEYSKRLNLNIHYEDRLLVLKNFDKKIVVYHGDYIEIVEALERCCMYDVVLYGHNHHPEIHKRQGIIVINPGSLLDYTEKGVERASFGIYDAEKHEGKIIYIDEL